MNASRVDELITAAEMAKDAAVAAVLRLYPHGTVIRFMLMHGQRNPSTGTVACAGSHLGYLRVRHHEAKPSSRYAYREVHYSKVLP